MPVFAYEGRTAAGDTRKGQLEAADADAARSRLRQMSIQPTSLKKAGGLGSMEISIPTPEFLKPKVGTKDLVVFVRQFATMIDSGLPLVQCLDIQSKQAPNPTFREQLVVIKEQVDAKIAGMSEEDQAWWESHIHYVTQSSKTLETWLGKTMKSPGWGVAIDRQQRLRYIGSYADYTRYDSSRGWFAPNLSMVANEAIYYNFEAEREATLEAENDAVTVIQVFDEPIATGWGGSKHTAEVELPDASKWTCFWSIHIFSPAKNSVQK